MLKEMRDEWEGDSGRTGEYAGVGLSKGKDMLERETHTVLLSPRPFSDAVSVSSIGHCTLIVTGRAPLCPSRLSTCFHFCAFPTSHKVFPAHVAHATGMVMITCAEDLSLGSQGGCQATDDCMSVVALLQMLEFLFHTDGSVQPQQRGASASWRRMCFHTSHLPHFCIPLSIDSCDTRGPT
jgi:hypothetical protein